MVTWKSGETLTTSTNFGRCRPCRPSRGVGGRRHVEGDRVVADRAVLFTVAFLAPCRALLGAERYVGTPSLDHSRAQQARWPS